MMTCSPCEKGFCSHCVDVTLVLVGRNPVCQCTRKNHSGEPNQAQILDPETGTVYAPGLVVLQDGSVQRTEPGSSVIAGDIPGVD